MEIEMMKLLASIFCIGFLAFAFVSWMMPDLVSVVDEETKQGVMAALFMSVMFSVLIVGGTAKKREE
jgi:hypothetical protein